MTSNRLILVGGGAFARELICWIEDEVDSGIGQRVTGFLDDNPKALEKFSYPYNQKWISTIDDYLPQEGDKLLMTISDPLAKPLIVEKLKKKGAKFTSLFIPQRLLLVLLH